MPVAADTGMMPVVVGFAPPDQFVVRATGNVTYAECERALDDILAHRVEDGPRTILIDARGVTGAPSSSELHSLARDMKIFIRRGYGPIAIVTDGAFVYGVARMFAVFAEAFGMSVSAFRSVDDAGAWLKTAPKTPSAIAAS